MTNSLTRFVGKLDEALGISNKLVTVFTAFSDTIDLLTNKGALDAYARSSFVDKVRMGLGGAMASGAWGPGLQGVGQRWMAEGAVNAAQRAAGPGLMFQQGEAITFASPSAKNYFSSAPRIRPKPKSSCGNNSLRKGSLPL